ncbi:MAG TPA: SRPBCC family protein [Candidatus Limnocylindria bacterium]|jgi:ribosome-associated toxin RatA of RatAB toxin-antitoxin module|nr:SRPBCC family protein [Candidatus Limnocylindria bacterium]
MHAEISVDVAASPARVFELAQDVTRWPLLLPHYRKVTIRSREGERVQVEMHATRPGRIGVPVSWHAEQWPDPSDPADLRLHFRHTAGATRGMAVTWHIRPAGAGARVTIEHDFRRPLPLLPADLLPVLIDRLFIKPIAGRTLATFKALAEAAG